MLSAVFLPEHLPRSPGVAVSRAISTVAMMTVAVTLPLSPFILHRGIGVDFSRRPAVRWALSLDASVALPYFEVQERHVQPCTYLVAQ